MWTKHKLQEYEKIKHLPWEDRKLFLMFYENPPESTIDFSYDKYFALVSNNNYHYSYNGIKKYCILDIDLQMNHNIKITINSVNDTFVPINAIKVPSLMYDYWRINQNNPNDWEILNKCFAIAKPEIDFSIADSDIKVTFYIDRFETFIREQDIENAKLVFSEICKGTRLVFSKGGRDYIYDWFDAIEKFVKSKK